MWPFGKKKSRHQQMPEVLYFKDSGGFFESQCKYGDTEIRQNVGIIAIVLNAQKEFGTQAAIKIEDDGRQLAMIRVASDDGGFVVPATTPSSKGDRLTPGDLVLWVPTVYDEEIGTKMGDKRAGWFGMIRARVAPEHNTITNAFRILCHYE